MANHQFNTIDNPSILYQNPDDILNPSILTPYSDQKFDLLDSKYDDAPFSYDGHNGLGIYDPYNDSGPSSVHFEGMNEALDHAESHINGNGDGINGNVRPDQLHDMPGMAGLPLPLSHSPDVPMSDVHMIGAHNVLAKPNGLTGHGAQSLQASSTMAITKNKPAEILDSIIVRG